MPKLLTILQIISGSGNGFLVMIGKNIKGRQDAKTCNSKKR
jgi:hypothetical protein